jgi:hypothetical protein
LARRALDLRGHHARVIYGLKSSAKAFTAKSPNNLTIRFETPLAQVDFRAQDFQ